MYVIKITIFDFTSLEFEIQYLVQTKMSGCGQPDIFENMDF